MIISGSASVSPVNRFLVLRNFLLLYLLSTVEKEVCVKTGFRLLSGFIHALIICYYRPADTGKCVNTKNTNVPVVRDHERNKKN